MSGIRFRVKAYTFGFFLLFSTIASGQADTLETSDTISVLDIVSFIDPPYVAENTLGRGSQSEPEGLVIEILEHLMSKARLAYKITLLPPKRAIIHASSTQLSCVLPIERNQEREAQFSWISPLIVSRTGLFSLQQTQMASEIRTLDDAKTYRIGSHLGSATGEYLESFSYRIDYAAQSTANIYKLKADRIDLWESDGLTAQYAAKEAGIPLSESKLDFFTSLRGIACHPSVPQYIIERMRTELFSMYKAGEINRISQRFLAQDAQ